MAGERSQKCETLSSRTKLPDFDRSFNTEFCIPVRFANLETKKLASKVEAFKLQNRRYEQDFTHN